MLRSTLLLLAVCALVAPLSAQFDTIAFESFDYSPTPQGLGFLGGGSGWENTWWSGGAGTDAMVESPGIDGIGAKARTSGFGGSYRKPDRNAWPSLTANDNFGVDGITLWFSFWMQRVSGSDDQYGGFSVFQQFVGEKLFLGCTYQSPEIGFMSFEGGMPNISAAIPGTSCDALSRVVARVDFMPGMERLRMWVNPGVDRPISSPGLDTMIYDLQFNEIRIESGANITASGYDFDRLMIEVQTGPLSADTPTISAATGGTQNMLLEGGVANAGAAYVVVGTLSGTMPGVPAGAFIVPINLDAYTTFTLFNPNTAPLSNNAGILDPNGEAVISLSLPPVGAGAVGLTAHHAGVVISGGAFVLGTNAVEVSITN